MIINIPVTVAVILLTIVLTLIFLRIVEYYEERRMQRLYDDYYRTDEDH